MMIVFIVASIMSAVILTVFVGFQIEAWYYSAKSKEDDVE